MAIAIQEWPATLPPPKQGAYSYTPESAAIETDFDSGYVGSRRRFTVVPTDVNVQWELCTVKKQVADVGSQLAIFEDFFHNILEEGILRFNTPILNGMGVNRVTAQFIQKDKQPYTVTSIDGQPNYVVVSAALRTISMPRLNP